MNEPAYTTLTKSKDFPAVKNDDREDLSTIVHMNKDMAKADKEGMRRAMDMIDEVVGD